MLSSKLWLILYKDYVILEIRPFKTRHMHINVENVFVQQHSKKFYKLCSALIKCYK